jgi:hypothetical protein
MIPFYPGFVIDFETSGIRRSEDCEVDIDVDVGSRCTKRNPRTWNTSLQHF